MTSADEYFILPDGTYKFEAGNLQNAHDKCFYKTMRTLWLGDKVVGDNTNTTAVEIAPYVALGRAFECDVRIVHMKCDLEVAFERNIHKVPRKVIEAQATRLQEPLPRFFPKEECVA